MVDSKLKAGSFWEMIKWELEKTYTLPMLAVIFAVAFYLFARIDGGGSVGYAFASVASVRGIMSGMVIDVLHSQVIDAYTFSSLIFAALASTVFSRDIASGYMRVLLSYPIGRTRLFLSKLLAALAIPFLVFAMVLTLLAELVFTNIFLSSDWLNMISVFLVLSAQMLFMLSISVTLSLHVRQPIMAFLSSIVLLIGIQEVDSKLPEPYNSLLPYRATEMLSAYTKSPNIFYSTYSSTHLLMAMIGLIVFPLILLVFDLLYFKWRLQV